MTLLPYHGKISSNGVSLLNLKEIVITLKIFIALSFIDSRTINKKLPLIMKYY